jgi:hypothetical protein
VSLATHRPIPTPSSTFVDKGLRQPETAEMPSRTQQLGLLILLAALVVYVFIRVL